MNVSTAKYESGAGYLNYTIGARTRNVKLT